MFPEKPSFNLREIKFGKEGKAESINRGFAITTLRNPRLEYNFQKGEVIEANCFNDMRKVPIVVISNETKPLNRQLIPVIALDGYFSADNAADDLRKIKGYEQTTRKSSLQAIVFIGTEKFNSLSQAQQHDLTHKPIYDLLKDRNNRQLFFPTMCYHLSDRGNLHDWINFLKVNGLISKEEKEAMTNYSIFGRDSAIEIIKNNPEVLKYISTKPEHNAFNPLVLGIPNKEDY